MTKIRLNDMQLVLLASAAQRDDGNLMPLPVSVGDQADREEGGRAAHQERPGSRNARRHQATAWREDGDTRFGAVITDAGRVAINAKEQDGESGAEQPAPKQLQPDPAPRVTKRSLLMDLLKREGGASLDEMITATGYLPHTTRAAMTGLRKSGMDVNSDKVDGTRRYRIAEAG